jgi:hypothetical protein
VYGTIKDSLEAQQALKNTLENKASMLLGFAGVMLALLIGARETILQLSQSNQILIVTSITLFGLSVLFAIVVTWVRSYRADPNPEALAKNYLTKEPEKTRLQLISNLIGVWKDNKKILERNSVYLRLTFVAQAIAFLCLGVALLLSIL